MPMKSGNKEKKIYYSPSEWALVEKRAALLGKRTGTYIREISVRGEIKKYDMKELNNLRMSFNRIGVQLNQIAKVANSTQSVYAKDVEDMRKQMDYFRTVMENYLTELKPELI